MSRGTTEITFTLFRDSTGLLEIFAQRRLTAFHRYTQDNGCSDENRCKGGAPVGVRFDRSPGTLVSMCLHERSNLTPHTKSEGTNYFTAHLRQNTIAELNIPMLTGLTHSSSSSPRRRACASLDSTIAGKRERERSIRNHSQGMGQIRC